MKTETITIDQFQNVDLRVAEVRQAERVEGTDRLLAVDVQAAVVVDHHNVQIARLGGRARKRVLNPLRLLVLVVLEPEHADVFRAEQDGLPTVE